MIAPLRNAARLRVKRKKRDIRNTFYEKEGRGPPADGFGILAAFDEIRLAPGKGSSLEPLKESEVVTYVYKGALAQEKSTGGSGVIHAGEFQRMTVGRGVRYKETNVSHTDSAHIFRITLHPSEAGLGCSHEEKRFAAADRHNLLCVVAAQDGRSGSLRIRQDALIYSSVLDPGHHLIHELASGRSAWVHVVRGEAALQDIILTQGDGVGVTCEPSVSVTAQENTEILVVDLGPAPRFITGS
jgi:hypothetical protein